MTDARDFKLLLEEVDEIIEPHRGNLLHGHIIATDTRGAIVDLGLKRDGVILQSDLDQLPTEEAHLDVGDEISVMVVDPLDPDGNLVVSVSQARESSDWNKARKLMEQGKIFTGVPQAFNRGGLIVSFGRLRGFVPASHLSGLPRGLDEAERTSHLSEMVGQELPFKVIEVDPRQRRLILSERKAIRQWRQQQKAKVIKELSEGEIRKGNVTSLREFGAFVDVGGADGLIHISELSWKHVDNPGEILEVGQEIETLIIRLDRDANRIGLSLKRLQANPWHDLTDHIQVGMECDGLVTRQAASGAYVCVEDKVEGLIHSKDGDFLPTPGAKVRIRVLSLDTERERMDLEWMDPQVSMDENNKQGREVNTDADRGSAPE